jgi:hypothetical protein
MSEVVIDAVSKDGKTAGALNSVSKSDATALSVLFASSPVHAGRINDKTQRTVLLSALESLTFSDAPDLNDVDTGGGGLPASPFVPNPASSPTGLPSDQPAAPDGYGNSTSNSFGTGPTANSSDRNPSIASQKVLERSLSSLKK